MSLQKSLLALLILTIASSVSSTTCGSNPLLDAYGITAAFSNAQIVPGISYCKSLQGKETCCDADAINGFQDKADDLLKKLSSAVGNRDQSLIKIRKDVLPSLTGKLASLKDAANKAAAKIQEITAAGGSGDMETDIMNAIVLAMAMVYSEMAKQLTDSLSVLRDDFTDYQKARSTCVVDIVKIQAAAWCLACDPEYTSKGVSVSGIEFPDNLVQTLTDSCTSYFTGAVTQSMIFSIGLMSDYLSGITAAFKKVANGNANGAQDFMTALTEMAVSQASLASDSMPVELPSGCTEDECDWIATTMFKGGELDVTSLTLGGSEKSSGLGTRRLEEELKTQKGRMLTNSWDPDTDEAGVTVTFSTNPGGVDNSSGVGYKSVIGGLVVLLGVLLI